MQRNDGAKVLASTGDGDEFCTLVERHSRTIFRLAFRMTANEQDAEDVVQETFMRAYRRLPQFENRADFGTWVYRIGVNCALDFIRSRQRHDAGREPIENIVDTSSHSLAAADPLPDRVVLSNEVQERVAAAMAELTPMEKAAFVLRHFEGRAIEEIAGILDVRNNAAKNTVFRAVKKLRKALEPLVSLAR
jgi:RNA polymerase sigma-70 factor, ECF subfamily